MPVPYGQKPDLTLIKILAAVIVIICLRVASPYITAMMQNLSIQIELQQALDEIEHPTGTELIQYQEAFGVLNGTGKHCDFFAGQLRSYSGSPETLLAHYDGLRYKIVDDYHIILLEEGQLPKSGQDLLPTRLKNDPDWELPANPDAQLYIVFLFLMDHGEDRDLRCR